MRGWLGLLIWLCTLSWSGWAVGGENPTFSARCSLCHQPDGKGQQGIYPPLAGAIGNYPRLPQGRTYLAHVVIHGLSGELQSKGATYVGLMPPAGDLSDAEIAAVLNYALTSFNASLLPRDFRPLTAAEIHSARQPDLTEEKLLRERQALIAELHKAGVLK